LEHEVIQANDAEGSSSQTTASQIVDPTQYQQEPQYKHLQYQQPHQQEQKGEGHQPEAEAQWEPAMEFEAGPQGFPGGPYELSLLPNFGKHVACRLWVDAEVSIIALFYLI